VVVALEHQVGERGEVDEQRGAGRDRDGAEDEVEHHATVIGSRGTLP
jgi:hypothetical protein